MTIPSVYIMQIFLTHTQKNNVLPKTVYDSAYLPLSLNNLQAYLTCSSIYKKHILPSLVGLKFVLVKIRWALFHALRCNSSFLPFLFVVALAQGCNEISLSSSV